jgi:hypothetical protein
MVRESVEEQRRRGKFKLIFPSDRFPQYKSFFEEERPLNVLLDKIFKELKIISLCLKQ